MPTAIRSIRGRGEKTLHAGPHDPTFNPVDPQFDHVYPPGANVMPTEVKSFLVTELTSFDQIQVVK